MLTRDQLESIRADAFAEDMELTDEMLEQAKRRGRK